MPCTRSTLGQASRRAQQSLSRRCRVGRCSKWTWSPERENSGSFQPLGAMIQACTFVELRGWLRLREAVWPHCSHAAHIAEMRSSLAQPERYAQYVFHAEPDIA